MTTRPSTGFRRLTVLTVAVTYLLIVIGGIVRVSGSGEGCGSADGADSWPLCHGSLVPPTDLATVIEFSHRIFATLSTVCIGTVMVWALVAHRRHVAMAAGAALAAVLLVIQIALGAITVQFSLPGDVVLIHLANAELVLATAAFVAVAAHLAGTGRAVAWTSPGPGARLAVGLAAATFLLILTGANVVAQGAGYACAGWPLCGTDGGVGTTLPAAGPDAINMLHRFVAGAVVVAVGWGAARVYKSRRGEPGMRAAFMAVNLALLLQVVAGAVLVMLRLPAWTRGLHIALASALWLAVFMLAILARRRAADRVRQPAGMSGSSVAA